MPAVEFDRVSKSFGVQRPWGLKDAVLGFSGAKQQPKRVVAVRDVSFSVGEGESLALLGHNGSGKSTVLKLLAGTIVPSSGHIRTTGRLAPLLELGAGFHPDLSGRENVFLNAAVLGVSRSYVKRHLDEIVQFAEVEDAIDVPVKYYSSGMAARLGFAIAVHVEADILLLDEVLAVGDASFQQKCLHRMASFRESGRTLILVTHSMPLAQSFCSRALVMHHGAVTYDGKVDEAATAYESSTRSLEASEMQ